jgi:sulfoxide reductase heme-binding subunit YedZ
MTLWFLARAAGFVALLAATVTVTLGAMGASARPTGGPVDAAHLDRRVLAQLVHRSAAVIAIAMLGLHAAMLIADKFVDVSIAGALEPFTAGYRGVAVGLGTLAAYGFLVVAASGALRGRLAHSLTASRGWRAVHLSAYAAWGLAMGHGLLSGTDTSQPWALALYTACGSAVGAVVTSRLVAAARHHRSPLPTARRIAAASSTPATPVKTTVGAR